MRHTPSSSARFPPPVMRIRLVIRSKLLLSSLVSFIGLFVLAMVTINAQRQQMIDDRITLVRHMTEVGADIIEQAYASFAAGLETEEAAKRRAVELLRHMRYGQDEYFFIDDFDGYSVLLPIQPDLEGQDASGLVDSQGRYFVEMQKAAALAGGGVVRYEFTKPGTHTKVEKLTYVRPFTPWRWFIATGVYLDDVDREIWTMFWRTVGVFGLIAFVTGMLLVLLARSITQPLGRLTTVIRKLAGREYDVSVVDQDRDDEIGDIARAVEIFKQNGQAVDLLQRKVHEQEIKAQAEREAALAFQRDSALRIEQTSRLVSMGEMAVSLAHEINQPLAAISNYCMGCVRRIESGRDDRPALLNAMRKAVHQAKRASDIVLHLRNFLSRKAPTLQPEVLSDIVSETASIAEINSRRLGFRIRRNIPADLPKVSADRVMIEQVVFNLMRNAIESTATTPAPRPDIVVSAWLLPDGQTVLTSVRDAGAGIPEESRETIFQPFYTTKSEGMGVGLNICRSIVEYHGGKLWLAPHVEGGVEFCFTLPVAVQD